MTHPNDPPHWPDRFGDPDTYYDDYVDDDAPEPDEWPSREDLAYDEVYG